MGRRMRYEDDRTIHHFFIGARSGVLGEAREGREVWFVSALQHSPTVHLRRTRGGVISGAREDDRFVMTNQASSPGSADKQHSGSNGRHAPERAAERRVEQAEHAERPSNKGQHVYAAALRATMFSVPVTAIGVTVVAYLIYAKRYAGEQTLPIFAGAQAVAIGVLSAFLIWLLFGYLYKRYTSAANASRRNYHSLRERLDQLRNRVQHANPLGYGAEQEYESGLCLAIRESAYARAEKECEIIARGLDSAGIAWVTGLGYVELWHRVHRAEEALIKVEPHLEALEGAMRDSSRIATSNLDNRDSLLKRLRCAVAVLDDPETGEYLSFVDEPERHPKGGSERATPEGRMKALIILSAVRYEINHFRDSVWEGIVHARNRLAYTSVVLGFATYALLGLAIFVGAPPNMIVWVLTYFLVGAIIGLFARAQGEWNANTAVDDFGLSTARLLHTPWLSGLAAVAGVLVTAIIDTHFLSESTNVSTLENIFRNSPSFLIIAAVFGLTPDLIIRRLTQQVDRYKGDLQSTQSSQSTEDVQVSSTYRSNRRQAG